MKIKICDILSVVVLFVLIMACLIAYLPVITGLDAYYVESESMRPTLKEGHIVFVKETPFDEIQINDIITFSNESQTKFCTHRVVSKMLKKYRLKPKGITIIIQTLWIQNLNMSKVKLFFQFRFLEKYLRY